MTHLEKCYAGWFSLALFNRTSQSHTDKWCEIIHDLLQIDPNDVINKVFKSENPLEEKYAAYRMLKVLGEEDKQVLKNLFITSFKEGGNSDAVIIFKELISECGLVTSIVNLD